MEGRRDKVKHKERTGGQVLSFPVCNFTATMKMRGGPALQLTINNFQLQISGLSPQKCTKGHYCSKYFAVRKLEIVNCIVNCQFGFFDRDHP